MANRRYIDFPIASTSGDTDIILIWQGGANKQTTKATFLSGLPENLDELNDVAISGLTNGQILRYDSVTGKWENTDQGNLDLNDLNDVSIVSPSNGQVLVYNSSTSRWENSSGGYVPYTGAVTTVNLGAQTIQAGSFVKAGGTSAQFLKANGSIDSTAYGTGSVTSVALTMPTAFSVANSPITTAGTLAVTGAGTVGQYIRGDGSLADFPESSGGGSSVSYYLNGSVNQGTIGGVAYKEINKVPIIGTGTDFTIAADGYIASFITDAGDPNLLEIPAGNWNFETYFSASSSGGTPSFYVELYKVNSGGTATLIASNSGFPEFIAFGTIITSYFSTLAVPTTALALTDRLAIRYYVVHSGRTITLHTEDNHLCQIITTFTTGLTALNGLTAQVQNFAVGTSGTDFAIASATATHTFNLPTASATNRGALSSADWTTFNNKTSNLGTVTSVGLSSATSGVTIGSTPVTTSGTITLAIATASGSQNGLLSSTDWTTFNGKQNALTNPVTGTGDTNYLPKFTGSTTIGNSVIQDNSNSITVTGFAVFNRSSLAFTLNPSYAGGNVYSQLQSTGDLALATGGDNNRFYINTSGNVLIGSPPAADNGARLQVSGTATFSSFITAQSSGGSGLRIYGGSGTNQWDMYLNGANIRFSDNTGTGSFVVDRPATFSSSVTANNNIFLANDGTYGSNYITLGFGGTTNGSNRIFAGTSSSVDGIFIASATGRPISFRAGGGTTDHVIITSGGNVLIGTTTDSGGKLRVDGDVFINNSSNSQIGLNTTGALNSVGAYLYFNRSGSNKWTAGMGPYTGGNNYEIATGSVVALSLAVTTGTATFGSLGTGSVTATAGTLSTVSDSSYKIEDGYIDSAIEKVLSLKPRYFYWNEKSGLPTDIRQLGFYAQEVNEVLGEEAANTPQNENTPWGISDRSIIAMLTKAIQELKQEIDTLKN